MSSDAVPVDAQAEGRRPDTAALVAYGVAAFLSLLAVIRYGVRAETPVIVISAWSHSDEAAIEAGADRFVAKPFDPNELRDAAVALLEDDGVPA